MQVELLHALAQDPYGYEFISDCLPAYDLFVLLMLGTESKGIASSSSIILFTISNSNYAVSLFGSSFNAFKSLCFAL
jgi:hypothetical protein